MRWLLEWIAAKLKARGRHSSVTVHGEPYIERYYLWKGVFLHQYLNADDGDRYQHNHPWRWSVGIPLVGGYTEERLVHMCPFTGIQLRLRKIRLLFPNVIMSTAFHRIVSVVPGTWTLFIHGRRLGGWGFLNSEQDRADMDMCHIWVEQTDPGIVAHVRKRLDVER